MSVEELKLRAGKGPIAFETSSAGHKNNSIHLAGFLVATGILAACFCFPLYKLLCLAFSDDLYSAIPLVPFLSMYLVWSKRKNLPNLLASSVKPAAAFFAAGFLSSAVNWIAPHGALGAPENYLALNVLALLLFFVGICYLFLGERFVRDITFPLALLVFTIPFPDFLRHGLEFSLQHGSAVFAGLFFQLSGTPVFRDGLNFHLPGCTLQVAPECSGIHSTLVLAITSLLGSWLFLRSPWRRTVLVLAIIPLALMRNGFRIFVIGRLCVAYGPQMLDSSIHRHGGPLFFVLSLIPLFLLLLFLRKPEQTKHSTKKIV
jgi:exosortase C (VPDSG-CTERM-specific)